MTTPIRHHDPAAPRVAARDIPTAEAADPPARVLLVEDDAALRRYLGVVLGRAGYDVTPAADGVEALRLALSGEFSAVVTDAVMPRLGGRELCRLLRARPELSALPVVLLTGLEAGNGAADSRAEPDARLSKPVRPADLLDCLARLLREGRSARASESRP